MLNESQTFKVASYHLLEKYGHRDDRNQHIKTYHNEQKTCLDKKQCVEKCILVVFIRMFS